MRRCALVVWQLALFSSCTLDRQPSLEAYDPSASSGAAWTPEMPQRAVAVGTNVSTADASAPTSAPVANGVGPEAVANDDAGVVTKPDDSAVADANLDASMPAMDPEPSEPIDAGSTVPHMPMTATDPSAPASAPPCQREDLRRRADAYLAAMASGKMDGLTLHPSLHYTENGSEERLGFGVWLARPQPVFTRHALDEQRCGSATEAVLSSSSSGEIVFALRLRYLDDKLIDVETQVVRPNVNYYNPKAIIVMGDDPWVQPLAADSRQDATQLMSVFDRFLESAIDASALPPTSPDCKLRQNGVDSGVDASGKCALEKDGQRLEQARYPVIDTTTGVVTAIGRRRGYIFMFFAKVKQGTLNGIEVVGGAPNTTTGW